ncbi:MAG: NADH-quinone oxidoreductase subunit L, partial [Planctomycetes bacterium]|nr:NADH-quinone oxidoreductase subunit L [Planctomycetota bacterium]
EQDIRKMGGLRKYMPITFWTFVIATVAIAGVPPFAGFWSKDEILWKAFSSHLPVPGGLLWGLGIAAAAFTAFYMTRLVVLTFFGQLRSAPGGGHGHDHAKTPHESPASMTLPLVVLAALAVVGGFVGTPHWMPQWLGGGVFETWLKPVCPPVESEASQPAGEHHGPPVEELLLMAVSVGIAAAGIGFAWRVYSVKKGAPAKAFVARHRALHEFVHAKYKVDELYDAVVVEPLLEFNEVLARFDNAVVDGAVNGAASGGATASLHTGYFDNEVVDGGVNATAHAVQATGRGLRRLQSGDIRQYLLTALVGGLVVMAAYSLYLRWDQIMTFFGC